MNKAIENFQKGATEFPVAPALIPDRARSTAPKGVFHLGRAAGGR